MKKTVEPFTIGGQVIPGFVYEVERNDVPHESCDREIARLKAIIREKDEKITRLENRPNG